jgi:predicted DNA-binding transcriptional regulator AlpA
MNNEQATTDQLISMPTVAEILNISVRQVWRLIREEELPKPVKLGRCSKMFVSDLQVYMQKLKQQRD